MRVSPIASDLPSPLRPVEVLSPSGVFVWLAADASEDRLADFCIATIQGAMLMGKIKRSAQPVEAAAKEALTHLRRYVALSAAKLET